MEMINLYYNITAHFQCQNTRHLLCELVRSNSGYLTFILLVTGSVPMVSKKREYLLYYSLIESFQALEVLIIVTMRVP
jgi:hypothetical protein